MSTIHLYPVNDIVDHDTDSDDCWCGPIVHGAPDPDGAYHWTITHHSIDGREFTEPDYDGAIMPSENITFETDDS